MDRTVGVEQQLAQRFTQRRPSWFSSDHNLAAACLEIATEPPEVSGFPRAVDAFYADEQTRHGALSLKLESPDRAIMLFERTRELGCTVATRDEVQDSAGDWVHYRLDRGLSRHGYRARRQPD